MKSFQGAMQPERNQDPSKTNKTQKRRHWVSRIHPGTLMVMIPLVAILSVLVLPGKRYHFSPPQSIATWFFQHGWPMVHFERCQSNGLTTTPPLKTANQKDKTVFVLESRKWMDVHQNGRKIMALNEFNLSTPEESYWLDEGINDGPYWLKLDNWKMTGDSCRIIWLGLLINLVVIGVLTFGVGWLTHRRFRRSGFRVSLKELALTTFVFGLLCMYYTSAGISEQRRLALDEIPGVKLYEPEYRYDAHPEHLVRLVGRRWLPLGNHFRHLVIDFENVSSTDRDLIARGMRTLSHIRIAKFTFLSDEVAPSLRHIKNVEELSLIDPKLTHDRWSVFKHFDLLARARITRRLGQSRISLNTSFFEVMRQCDDLEELELEGCDFASSDFSLLKGAHALRRLTIDDCPIDEQVIETIESIPNLSYLSVRGGRMTHSMFDQLERSCPRLLIFR